MLEALGFEPAEETAYDLLLAHGRLSFAALAVRYDGTPHRLRQALSTLEAKGLVRRLTGPAQEYVVAPPEHAIEVLIAERMGALQGVRAQAAEISARVRRVTQDVDPTALIEIVSGEGSVRQLFMQVVKSAKQEIAVFDAPPYAIVADEAEVTTGGQRERMRGDGLRLRTVFDRSLLEDPTHVRRITEGIQAGEEARIDRVPLKLAIIDREWGILPLLHAGEETPEAAVIVRRSVLLDSMLALFELVWQHAAEIKVGASEDLVLASTDERDLREIARLLAAGLTDTAIAHHLGVSERTVRRRIKDLLLELRVDSRFAAGVRAVQRGWLSGD